MNFYECLEKNAVNDGVDRLVVGAIITNENGEIFLAKRKQDDFMGGFYEIPGGNAEKGEGIYSTLLREIKEETNLNIEKVLSYIDYFDYKTNSGKKCRQFNFKVVVSNNSIVLTEHDSYKWISLNDIEKEDNISPEVKHTLLVYKFNEDSKVVV